MRAAAATLPKRVSESISNVNNVYRNEKRLNHTLQKNWWVQYRDFRDTEQKEAK
jgi:hypothetical protein